MGNEKTISPDKSQDFFRTQTAVGIYQRRYPQITEQRISEHLQAYQNALYGSIHRAMADERKPSVNVLGICKFTPSPKILAETYFNQIDECYQAPRNKKTKKASYTKSAVDAMIKADTLIANHIEFKMNSDRERFQRINSSSKRNPNW